MVATIDIFITDEGFWNMTFFELHEWWYQILESSRWWWKIGGLVWFSYICWNSKYVQKSPDLSLEFCVICVGRVSSRHRRRQHGQSAISLSVAPRGRWQSWSRRVWYHLSAIFWIARTHRWSALFWMASTTCWRWQVIRSIN